MDDKRKEGNVVEFISKEAYEREQAMEGELSRLATGDVNTRVRVPREVGRKRVINAFQDAFELIGGTPRLADWANDHPTEFYKLYGKLLPSGASAAFGEANELVVRHVLPQSPLDADVPPEKK